MLSLHMPNGFSCKHDNPFEIFTYLHKQANKHYNGEIFDLSRGDPWITHAPNAEPRRLYSFITLLDTYLNTDTARIEDKSDMEIHTDIARCLESTYTSEMAQKQKDLFDCFIIEVQKHIQKEYPDISQINIIRHFFSRSFPTWGSYHHIEGDEIIRAVFAGIYRKNLNDESIRSENLIFVNGVNDAIGTLFQFLGNEGIGHLDKKDAISTMIPSYYPYLHEVEQKHYTNIPICIDPKTGDLDLSYIEDYPGRIKIFLLIDPNNPTWFAIKNQDKKHIAQLAKKHNAIIISDEIYSDFFSDFTSIWNYAKEHTIRLQGRSKIYRLPWIRFGDILISNETNTYISKHIIDLKNQNLWEDFRNCLIHAKWPWSVFSGFFHTAMTAVPSQMIGVIHSLMWEKETKVFGNTIKETTKNFHSSLNLPQKGNCYFSVFRLCDLDSIALPEDFPPIEELLIKLAKEYGIILMPAYRFFDSNQIQNNDRDQYYVRASLANIHSKNIPELKKRIQLCIKSFLSS